MIKVISVSIVVLLSQSALENLALAAKAPKHRVSILNSVNKHIDVASVLTTGVVGTAIAAGASTFAWLHHLSHTAHLSFGETMSIAPAAVITVGGIYVMGSAVVHLVHKATDAM